MNKLLIIALLFGASTCFGFMSDDSITVGGETNATDQNIFTFVNTNLNQILPTGLLLGGLITTNATDPTWFNVAGGTGRVAMVTDGSLLPLLVDITWSAFNDNVASNLIPDNLTYLWINTNGGLVQSSTLDNDDFRTHVVLGNANHPMHVDVSSVSPALQPAQDAFNNVNEYIRLQGPQNISGNIYSDNGANLELQRSAGSAWRLGSAYYVDPTCPNIWDSTNSAGALFFRVFDDGSGMALTNQASTTVDPDVYDDGSGTLGVVPNNRWTIKQLWYGPANNDRTVVRLTENHYATQQDAFAAIQLEDPFVTDSFELFVLRSFLIVKKGTTELNDVALASFHINTGRSAGGGSASVPTMQATYENSGLPKIVTSDLNGPVQVQNGRSLNTNKVEEILDISGNEVYSVNGEGSVYASNSVSSAIFVFTAPDGVGTNTLIRVGVNGNGDPISFIFQMLGTNAVLPFVGF